MGNSNNIFKEVDMINEDVIAWRRDLHMHPELGFDVERTAKKVEDLLISWGIKILTHDKDIGVVGLIEGGGKGDKTVALRADMDALPINEENNVVYKSKYKDKMHACGHDGHTAMLLGAARVLNNNKEMINGNVKLIFQPAEEGPDLGGAKPMIEEGALEGVDAIFGIHLTTEYPTGTLSIKLDESFASTDEFEIRLIGKGGHAGSPHLAVDPIAMAARVFTEIQYMVSRQVDPQEALVISVGSIHAGNAKNVIADYCDMAGTIRSYESELRKEVKLNLEKIVKNISEISGGTYELKIDDGLPSLINDTEMSNFLIENAKEVLGDENTIILKKATMGAEDFAYYLEKIPGAYAMLGARNEEKGFINMMHNANFDFDEESLNLGVKIHITTAINFLNKNKE